MLLSHTSHTHTHTHWCLLCSTAPVNDQRLLGGGSSPGEREGEKKIVAETHKREKRSIKYQNRASEASWCLVGHVGNLSQRSETLIRCRLRALGEGGARLGRTNEHIYIYIYIQDNIDANVNTRRTKHMGACPLCRRHCDSARRMRINDECDGGGCGAVE